MNLFILSWQNLRQLWTLDLSLSTPDNHWSTKSTSIVFKQPVDNEEQSNNVPTWFICWVWFVEQKTMKKGTILSWWFLVQMEERIPVHSSNKIKLDYRKEEFQNKWYRVDSNRCRTKQLAYGKNFGNHQGQKHCCSKCENVNWQEKIKFHFMYLGAINK